MAPTRLDLQNYVPALLTFVSNKLSRGASTTYRRLFGIGVTEWRVISLLALEPGIPAHRICHVIGFDKALVSRTVQILLDQAYVVVRSNKHDSRSKVISLTAKGLQLHDKVIKVALEREKLLLGNMSDSDRKTLIRLLRALHERVEVANAFQPANIGKTSRYVKSSAKQAGADDRTS